jgi:hypothetical protein
MRMILWERNMPLYYIKECGRKIQPNALMLLGSFQQSLALHTLLAPRILRP